MPRSLRPWLKAWLLLGASAPAVAALAAQSDLGSNVDGSAPPPAAIVNPCKALPSAPWPTTPIARRELLQRMELARPGCMSDAPFLAALGALWLDEGEQEQALVWLERALMLEPELPGAQVDHALALAALGEPAAAIALAQAWQIRTDVPPAVRHRLQQVVQAAARGPRAQAVEQRWFRQRELNLVAGYETNLDNSPRLVELTLTAPEGEVSLPVISQPRRGAATLAEASWQLAYIPQPGQVWRTGVNLGARSSPVQPRTDWHQVQWAGSGSQQWAQWRGQVEVAVAQVGGPLNEPYRVLHLGVAVDRQAWGCKWRLGSDAESRTQSQTSSANARIYSVSASTQCLIPAAPSFTWTAVLQAGVDQAVSEERPGGDQRLWQLRLRVNGTLGQDTKIDAGIRLGQTVDGTGYSSLLNNNARRRVLLPQMSVELARPLHLAWWPGAEAVAQFHANRAQSNLPLFSHNGASLYMGMRWAW